MRRNRPRSSIVLSSPITLILALVLLFFLGRAAISIHAKATDTASKLAEEQATLVKLQANKSRVAADLAQVSTEAGIKAEIREKYHAVEPGESVAVIVDTDQNAAAAGNIAENLSKKSGFWHSFLSFFGL